ncbi:MAG TPA: hypothetical protein V6D12_08440 [Candidatus Obscuribacterales bacterium]
MRQTPPMEYWEFLLQKEGDRSWLPLKTPRSKIKEGRYRVAAHSNRPNTDVEIRLTHQEIGKGTQQRRSATRSHRTNAEGLLVVLPFTYLKPGIWELRCSSDIISDLLGETWHKAIQLQVVAKSAAISASPETPLDTTSTPAEAILHPDLKIPIEIQAEAANPVPAVETSPSPVTPLNTLATETLTSNQAANVQVQPAEEIAAISQPESNSATETHPEAANPVPTTSEIIEQNTSADVGNYSGAGTDLPISFTDSPDNEQLSLASDAHQIHDDNPNTSPEDLLIEESLQNLEQFLEQLFDPLLEEAQESESGENGNTAPGTTPSPRKEADAIVFSTEPTRDNLQASILSLNQSTFVARRGEPLRLSGQVNVKAGSATTNGLSSIFQGAMRLELRNPQNSQLLLDVEQPLSEQVPTFAFKCNFPIPKNCQTRLILGTVTLHDAKLAVLASQAFTITVDLEELIEEILVPKPDPVPGEFGEEDLPEPPPEVPLAQDEEPEGLNLTFFDLIKAQPTFQPLRPAASHPLPPQIYQPTSNRKASKVPELPKLPKLPIDPLLETAEEELDEAMLEVGSDGSRRDSAPEEEAAGLGINSQLGEASVASPSGGDASGSDHSLVNSEPEMQPAEEDPPFAPEPAFKALKLPERFWSRLNALATEVELPEELPKDEETSADSSEIVLDLLFDSPFDLSEDGSERDSPFDSPDETSAESPEISLEGSTANASLDWGTQEIVIEDEDLPVQEPPASEMLEAELSRLIQMTQPTSKPLGSYEEREDEQVPTPELIVPTGELIAGESLVVRVILPPESESIYVKLWVKDRQSRSILEEPRLLVDFPPNESGTLETMTQLTVPFGILELRLEAIAINSHTHRESHKVTVDRVVVPPDVPQLFIDDFQS